MNSELTGIETLILVFGCLICIASVILKKVKTGIGNSKVLDVIIVISIIAMVGVLIINLAVTSPWIVVQVVILFIPLCLLFILFPAL